MAVHPPRSRRLHPAIAAALACAAALLVAAPVAGAATTSKPYRVDVAPTTVAAGVTRAFTVTLTNNTGTQQLGSANVTVPAAFVIEGTPSITAGDVARSGNVLLLRTLAVPPSGSVTVTMTLRMPCVAGTSTWSVAAKQSNDFSGPPGNTLGPLSGSLDTTVTGHCALRFVAQPAGTLKGEPIRATPFAPQSTGVVTVEAVDGSSTPQPLTWFTGPVAIALGPTSYPGQLTPSPDSVAAVAGLASYGDLRIDAAGIYTLRATTSAAGFVAGGTLSAAFQVVDVVSACARGSSCSATLPGTGVTAAPADTGGLLLLSRNVGTEPVCAGYAPPTGSYFEFELTAARDDTIVLSYTKAEMRTVKSLSALQVCFASPLAFPAKGGGAAAAFDYDGATANGAEGFVALLPDCAASRSTPCVTRRDPTGGGGALIEFFVPAAWGDPRYH